MEQYIKELSHRIEFAIVILVAFGYPVLVSVISVLSPVGEQAITNADLLFLLLYEVTLSVFLGLFLRLRGWRPRQLGLIPAPRDIRVGIGLAVFDYLAFTVIVLIFSSLSSGLVTRGDHLFKPELGLMAVTAVSIVNPLFEEIFVCGYVISVLRKSRSLTFAINVSVCIRLVYHLYQGPVGVVSIIPLGLVFAYWFAKTGRLWPLVIAHAIIDFFGLLVFVSHL
jgi:uncharacterized protein